MSSTPDTILIRVNDRHSDRPHYEYSAGGAITPGHFVQLDSDGDVTVHGTAAGASTKWIAVENQWLPASSTSPIDTAYASADILNVVRLQPGDEVYAWLEDEANVAVGATLESDGAGGLQAVTTGDPIAIALEAVDNTGGSGQVRIKVAIV